MLSPALGRRICAILIPLATTGCYLAGERDAVPPPTGDPLVFAGIDAARRTSRELRLRA
jgi:hypothetical protein